MTPKNGYVPAAMLVPVEGLLLARDTAAAYLRAKAAAAADGVTLSIARPAGAYRTYAVQQDMHIHPGLYNLDPTSTAGLAAPGHSGHGLGNRVDINGNGRAWFLAHGGQFGFDREFGSADPGHYRFAGETWGSGGAASAPAATSWHVGQTNFKGTYGENELNGARWYCIEPDTGADKTIYAVAAAHGVTLDQVRAWTASVAASKWGGPLLQAGSSWWAGSNRYYAGVCIALNDVAAILSAFEEQYVIDQQAAQAAEVAATAAVQAQLDATDAAIPPLTASTAVTPLMPSSPPVKLTKKQLAAYNAELTADAAKLATSSDADLSTPLSGLFAGHPIARRRAYLSYAGAVLLVSFAPDIVTAGLLTGHQVPVFVSAVQLTTSVLLKLGAALGFVAASNAGKS